MDRRAVALLVATAAAVSLAACGRDDSGSELDSSAASLEYRFRDSSVPPEYHRSYTLTLTGSADGATGELVVDSYGDELHRVPVDVDGAGWRTAVDALDDLALPISSGDDGCAGGTGREVEVSIDGERQIAADIEVCGDAGGDAADRLDAVIAPLLATLDMDELLATE